MPQRLKIVKQEMFYTPESQEELMERVQQLGAEAIIASAFTWNYLAHQQEMAEANASSQNPYANIEGEEDDV